MNDVRQTGFVSIVGAGPGPVDLMTLRALDRLQRAEVVVHDRLISPDVLARVPAGAQRLYVGKALGDHSVPQAGIHALLVQHARAGQRVPEAGHVKQVGGSTGRPQRQGHGHHLQPQHPVDPGLLSGLVGIGQPMAREEAARLAGQLQAHQEQAAALLARINPVEGKAASTRKKGGE